MVLGKIKMNYKYLIPIDAKYFFMGAVMLNTLKKNGTELSKVFVLDFGLSKRQISFLIDFGVKVLPRPNGFESFHPYKMKSHLKDFIKSELSNDFFILMDADMIVLKSLDKQIEKELSDMESNSYKISLCQDMGAGRTIEDFINNFENTKRFESLIDVSHYKLPYLNIGFTIFSNQFDFDRWTYLTSKTEGDICYEQSAINVMCAGNTDHKILNSHEYNYHGHDLLSKYNQNTTPSVIHFTSHRDSTVHIKQEIVVSGKKFRCYTKSASNRLLQDLHRKIIDSFINDQGALLIRHFK